MNREIYTITGEWVRPISANLKNEGAVPVRDITYSDSHQVQILDKVRLKLLEYKPTISQPENYLYDSKVKWEETGKSSLKELIQFRDYDRLLK